LNYNELQQKSHFWSPDFLKFQDHDESLILDDVDVDSENKIAGENYEENFVVTRNAIIEDCQNTKNKENVTINDELKDEIFNYFEERQRELCASGKLPFLFDFSSPTAKGKFSNAISKRRDKNIEFGKTNEGFSFFFLI